MKGKGNPFGYYNDLEKHVRILIEQQQNNPDVDANAFEHFLSRLNITEAMLQRILRNMLAEQGIGRQGQGGAIGGHHPSGNISPIEHAIGLQHRGRGQSPV